MSVCLGLLRLSYYIFFNNIASLFVELINKINRFHACLVHSTRHYSISDIVEMKNVCTSTFAIFFQLLVGIFFGSAHLRMRGKIFEIKIICRVGIA